MKKKKMLAGLALGMSLMLMTSCKVKDWGKHSDKATESIVATEMKHEVLGSFNDLDIQYDYSKKKITWKTIKNAFSYIVRINGVDKDEVKGSCSYEYPGDSGDFSVQIVAKDESGKETSSNVIHFYRLEKLSSNQIVYSFGTFSWPKVTNATGYRVYVNGEKVDQEITDNQYKLKEAVSGNVSFAVEPLSNKNDATNRYYSDVSETKTMNILPSPSLSFEKNTYTISWNGVSKATGYLLVIEKNNSRVIEPVSFGVSGVSYNSYTFSTAGVYTVKVAALGDNSDGLYESGYSEFNVTRLAAPKNVHGTQGNDNVSLNFDGVSDGPSNVDYEIACNGTSMGSTGGKTAYTIPYSESGEEQTLHYSVKSTSTDNYVLDSTDAGKVDIIVLGMPKNLIAQNGRLHWDKVDKAVGYEICIDGGAPKALETNEYTPSNLGSGSHTFKVRACGNKTTTFSSKFTETYKVVKLTRPTNLSMSQDHILSWDPVMNSSAYEVKGANGSIDENTISSSYRIGSITSQTSITVTAKGNGSNVFDSDPSDTFSLYKLNAPETINVKDGQLVWNAVKSSSSYKVYIGDYEETTTGTAFSFDNYNAGVYRVMVSSVGKGQYYSSDKSAPVTVTKLEEPISLDLQKGKGLVWSPVLNATGYEIRIDNEPAVTAGASETSKMIQFKTSGKHRVSVRALGNDLERIISSNWSSKDFTVNALATPDNLKAERLENNSGFSITADIDNNSEKLSVVFGGVVYTASEDAKNVVTIPTVTPGEYEMFAYAKGDELFYVDSEKTKTEKLNILTAPSNLTAKKTNIENLYIAQWVPVKNADYYSVKIKKTMMDGEIVVTENQRQVQAQLSINVKDVTKIEIEITAESDNPLTIGSALVNYPKVLNN